MPKTVTGIEVGPRAAVFLRGHVKGNTFAVTDYAYQPLDARETAAAWDQLEAPFAPKAARVGVTGKEVNLRYTRVPRLPDWQLRRLMRFEVEEVGGTSASAVAADFNLLPAMPEIEGEDVAVLAMVRESALEAPTAAVRALGGTLDAFSPNAIALYNAWLRFGVVLDDTVLLAHVGHDSTDVVLVRGADLVFARNLSGGTHLFSEAIAGRLGVPEARAEAALTSLVDLTPGARVEGDVEKATRAALGAAGQVLGLLQSAVMFARTQVKLGNLKLDRVFLSGRGATVRGIDRYLSNALGVPVDRFDPFQVVDTSKLAPEAAAELERRRPESVVALGLASAGSDPDAYAVEILPAQVAKRREFMSGTVFLIAAAVLAVAFLVHQAIRTRGTAADVAQRARAAEARAAQNQRVNSRTQELARANADLAAKVAELRAVAALGEQASRVLEALDRTLPETSWATSIAARRMAEPSLGLTRGAEAPVVIVEGRAREGVRDRSEVFKEFSARFAEQLPGFAVVPTISPDGARFTLAASAFASRAATASEESR